jgi:protein-tyrosine phosphatase
MSYIDENIYIGTYLDSNNELFLRERGITCILNCADEFPNPPSFFLLPGNAKYEWYRVPIVDDVADELTEDRLREGAAKIKEWISDGKKVLVHCHAGISRAVSTVMTYYMVYKGWSYDVAYSHIKQRRPQMFPHPNFLPILRKIESS